MGSRLSCPIPASLSTIVEITGRLKILPTPGVALKNVITTGKKEPKRLRKPKPSTAIPIIGHRHKTITIPPMKHKIPLHRSFLVKNLTVRDTPIVSVRPVKKRILPIASSLELKKNMQPKTRNKTPTASSKVPIFLLSSESVQTNCQGCAEVRMCLPS